MIDQPTWTANAKARRPGAVANPRLSANRRRSPALVEGPWLAPLSVRFGSRSCTVGFLRFEYLDLNDISDLQRSTGLPVHMNILLRVTSSSEATNPIVNLAGGVVRSARHCLLAELATSRDTSAQHSQIISASKANPFTVETDFKGDHPRLSIRVTL